jgi:hypothetical protein
MQDAMMQRRVQERIAEKCNVGRSQTEEAERESCKEEKVWKWEKLRGEGRYL